MRTVTFVAALAALATSAAAAQQRPRQAPAQAAPPAQRAQAPDSTLPGPMGRRMGMGTGGLAGWLASNPAALNLTADQLTRIRAARDEEVRTNAPLRAQLQAAFADRDWRALSPADRRALMDSTRGVREQIRANAGRARTTVTGILTAEQQQTLDRTRPRWRTGGPGPAMGGGRGRWMMMRRGSGMAPAGWMRRGRGAGPGMWIGYRMGWRAGWRAGLRAEWRLERGLPRI